tara:strand:+ start:163 stop:765 length:603 start_codon:yes stop_codon:yes gene_type:complete
MEIDLGKITVKPTEKDIVISRDFETFKDKNLNPSDVVDSLLDVSKKIAVLEGNDPKAINPQTKAAGKWQWKTQDSEGPGKHSSFVTALNRTQKYFSGEGFNNPSWLEEAYKHQDPTKLTEKQQETVFLSDFLQRKGTTKMLKNYTKNPSIETFQPLYNAWHTKGSGPNMRKYILDKLPEFKKKLGGMIEKDPYKRQPKFI